MALKHLFVIIPPYDYSEIQREIKLHPKIFKDGEWGVVFNPRNESELRNKLANVSLDKDAKVLILGGQQLEIGGLDATSIVKALTRLPIGQNVITKQKIYWEGDTYINSASQALVDKIKEMGAPGSFILRGNVSPALTSSFEDEIAWIEAYAWISNDMTSKVLRSPVSLLTAVANMHWPVTIIPPNADPLVFNAQMASADIPSTVLSTVKTYAQQQVDLYNDPEMHERMQALVSTAQHMGEWYVSLAKNATIALLNSFNGGLEGFLRFAGALQPKTLELLLNRSEGGEWPLSRAAATGDENLVKQLLNRGAILLTRDGTTSALAAAISAERSNVVKYLLNNTPVIAHSLLNLVDEQGVLPISLAARKSEEILNLILAYSPSAGGTLDMQSGPNNNTALIDAAVEGSAGSVLELLRLGANQKIVGKDKRTALSSAAAAGRLDIVNIFLDNGYGSEINAKDADGNTALHLAAYKGHTEVVRALFVNYASQMIENNRGEIPFFAAAKAGKIGALKILMSNPEVSTWKRSSDGWTALHQAAFDGRVEVIQALLQEIGGIRVVDIYAKTKLGETPLMLAVKGNSKAAFDELITKVVNLADKNVHGQTVLDLALDMLGDRGNADFRDEMIRKLIEKEAPIPLEQRAVTGGATVDNVVFYPTMGGRPPTKLKTGVIFGGAATVRGGVTIGTGAYVGIDADIGAGATIEDHAHVGHYAVIGAGVFIGHNADVGNNVKIGTGAQIGVGAKVGNNVYIEGGLKIRQGQVIDANWWVDRKGIYAPSADGIKGRLVAGNLSPKYKALVKPVVLKASAGDFDLPGNSLRDPDPDASAGAIAGGERRPGEFIDEDAEHSDDAQVGQAGWKKVLAQLRGYPVVGSEDSPPALTADEYRALIEHNLAGALDAVFASEHLDFVARVPLVAQGVSHFKQYLLPGIDKALSALDAAAPGGVIGLDALSAKLGEQSVDKHIQDSLAALEATDPKSSQQHDQARRQAGIVFAELAGDLRYQVTVGRVLVADAGLHSFWSQVETQLGSGDRAATRNRFMQLIDDRYGSNNKGAAPWERDQYLKRQGELFVDYLWPLIDQRHTSKAAGGAGIVVPAGQSAEQALLQAVPKQVMQADQAALGELLREVGGLSAHQLPLTPEAAHTQFNDFMNAVGQARDQSRQGVPQLANEQRLRAFDELVQARELPGSPALRESMGHYGSAGDFLFTVLGSWGIHQTLQARARAVAQGLDTRELDVSLVHQVAMTGTMGALLVGRVAEGVAGALGAGELAAGLQKALGGVGRAFTGAVALQQVGDIIAAGVKYHQDSQQGSLTEEDKWALGGSIANLAVLAIGLIPGVGPELALAAQTVLPNWNAIGSEGDLQAQVEALRAQGMHHEADFVQVMASVARDQSAPIFGAFSSTWTTARLARTFAKNDAAGLAALQHEQDAWRHSTDAGHWYLSGDSFDWRIVPKRADLASNPGDADQVHQASVQAYLQRLQAQVAGTQDWFQEAFKERVQARILGKSDELALLDQQLRRYQALLDAKPFSSEDEQEMDAAKQSLVHAGFWDAARNAPTQQVPLPRTMDNYYYFRYFELQHKQLAHQQAVQLTAQPMADATDAQSDILARQQAHTYEWRSQPEVLLAQLEASGGAFKSAWLINSHDESFEYDSAVYARTGTYSLHNSEHGNSERVDASTALHLKAPADWAALGLRPRPGADASEADWSAYRQQLRTRYEEANRATLQASLTSQAGLSLQTHFTGTTAASESDTWHLGANADSALIVVQDDTGNALDNAIAGTGGANVLAGGAGNDTLMGGAGADTYRFNRGDGQDVISDGESFATSVDVLQFGAGIGSSQLWLRKVAAASPLDRYDLEVQVMGTGDKVTIAGWERAGGFGPYDPNANHIEQIRSSDGKMLLDTKVAQLVDAMASMAPPTGATSWSQLTAGQQAQLNALGAWG